MGAAEWESKSRNRFFRGKFANRDMDNPPRTKVVAVIGSTGVGKTKLSVELARRFNGEVVNADVMQMHRGLDVATAKVSEEERGGVPHHLLSFLDPLAEFTPLQCVAEARVSA